MMAVISQQNWLEPDDATKVFARISPVTGAIEPTVGQDWLNDFIEPKLQESVPPDVQALFELARGAMVYGYFYYPLYYLGFLELARVAEAAAHHKCKADYAGSCSASRKVHPGGKWTSYKMSCAAGLL